jgi:hypothetical protein
MKRKATIAVLLLILLTFNLSRPAHYAVQNYYFAAAGTDGGACSISVPCKTIAYLNTITITGGDSIFFNRNDTFPGEIIPTSQGSSGHIIWWGAYGTGVNPVINGLYRLVGYTNVGTNLWTASCASCPNFMNQVVYNGSQQGMGRTPNNGYDTVAATGTTYITDPSLAGTSFGTGELVLRVNHYTMTRNIISSQSGDTIRYTAKNGTATTGWGFFIQNNLNTLDTVGEWWYDSTAHLMHIYLPDTTVPVQVGVVDTLINLSQSIGKQYMTFDHLTFQGANDVISEMATNSNIIIQNCILKLSNTGITGPNVNSSTIVSNNIGPLNDLAVQITSGSANKIDSNHIHDVGSIPGMGIPTSAYEGLQLQMSTSEINWNRIVRVGYDGIAIKGTRDTVNYNLIDSFCYILDDGGGIYWYENLGASDSSKRCIGNMVYNGISAPAGVTGGIAGETGAVGIYADQSSTGIEIDSNTLFNNSQANGRKFS